MPIDPNAPKVIPSPIPEEVRERLTQAGEEIAGGVAAAAASVLPSGVAEGAAAMASQAVSQRIERVTSAEGLASRLNPLAGVAVGVINGTAVASPELTSCEREGRVAGAVGGAVVGTVFTAVGGAPIAGYNLIAETSNFLFGTQLPTVRVGEIRENIQRDFQASCEVRTAGQGALASKEAGVFSSLDLSGVGVAWNGAGQKAVDLETGSPVAAEWQRRSAISQAMNRRFS